MTPGTAYDYIAQEFAGLRTCLLPHEREYLALVCAGCPPGSTILDLGCGTGTPVAVHLVAQGYRVVGVDGSAPMLAQAVATLPGERWIHALMEEVDFGPDDFAGAVVWDSLFHLPRRQYGPVLRKVYRWLRSGGRLMVSSGGRVEDDAGFTDTMFGHEFYYDSLPPAEMMALVEEIGFAIIRAEMCDPPTQGQNKGKWATVAQKPYQIN